MVNIINLAWKIKSDLKPFSRKIEITGSIRRKIPNPKDIDILIIPRDVRAIYHYLSTRGKIVAGGKKRIDADINGIRVNVLLTTHHSWAAALMHFTGPKGANIHNRKLAISKGYKLTQDGVFKDGRLVYTPTESSIYDLLGKSYRRPEDRGKPR